MVWSGKTRSTNVIHYGSRSPIPNINPVKVHMKIRSITYFLNPGWPLNETKMQMAGSFLREAKQSFENAGYTVQTAINCT